MNSDRADARGKGPRRLGTDSGLAVTANGVCKRFVVTDTGNAWRILMPDFGGLEQFDAVMDVDLEVPRGEFVGVIGRNGAGKSTLLRVLGGVYEPTRGRVRTLPGLSALYELGVAGNVELTGREYAARYLELAGTAPRDIPTLLPEIEAFSELGDRFDDSVRTYSAGMQARLFFATATTRSHAVYLIDEALSVGDAYFQAKCWARIRDRLSGGASGVLVTHDWSAVLKLCRSAHIMSHGRVVASGPAPDVVRQYLQEELPTTGLGEEATLECRESGSVRWRAGTSARVRFRIAAEVVEPLHLVFAVEKLKPGFGWEIMLNGIDLPVVLPPKGTADFELEIPALPLVPGHYFMSASLVRLEAEDGSRRSVLDGFGWLTGDPLEIDVEGEPGDGELRMPYGWSVLPANASREPARHPEASAGAATASVSRR